MTYRGKVTNGVVVLEDPKALPEGSVVKVEPVDAAEAEDREALRALSEKLLRFAGTARGLPSDMARNHDHYLHGQPKQ